MEEVGVVTFSILEIPHNKWAMLIHLYLIYRVRQTARVQEKERECENRGKS